MVGFGGSCNSIGVRIIVYELGLQWDALDLGFECGLDCKFGMFGDVVSKIQSIWSVRRFD